MSGTSTLDDAPLVVFHQCTEAEWKSWGIATANKMAAAGLVVVRVKTEPWQDLKKREANAFRTPLTADQNEQQMICTIVMRDITCPFLLKVVEDMGNGTLPKNMREWVPSEDLQIVLPPGTEPCRTQSGCGGGYGSFFFISTWGDSSCCSCSVQIVFGTSRLGRFQRKRQGPRVEMGIGNT